MWGKPFQKGNIPWNKDTKGVMIAWNKGKKCPELIGNTRGFKKGQVSSRKGVKLSEEARKKMSENSYWKGKFGEESAHWKGGNCKKYNERNDPLYQNWIKQIRKRDNNTCKINNKDCSGYRIVHHILPWRDYPELRYNINNGITLCQAHHPRKRAEEKLLIPFFSGLVSVSNELI